MGFAAGGNVTLLLPEARAGVRRRLTGDGVEHRRGRDAALVEQAAEGDEAALRGGGGRRRAGTLRGHAVVAFPSEVR